MLNQKAPFPTPLEFKETGGAIVDFLKPETGNYLFVYLPRITRDEIEHMQNAHISSSFLVSGCFIHWIFDIEGQTVSAPFNFHAAELEIPDLYTDSDTLTVTLLVIDSETNLVKVEREFKLHPKTSRDFVGACLKIAADGFDNKHFREMGEMFLNDPNQLPKDTSNFLPCSS